MYATNPYPFRPNASEEYVRKDVTGGTWSRTTHDVQWLKPFITIGEQSDVTLTGTVASQLFFAFAQIYHRGLIKGDFPLPHCTQFRTGHTVSGGILRPDNRVLWILDAERFLDPDDLDGDPLTFFVAVRSFSGTDYNGA